MRERVCRVGCRVGLCRARVPRRAVPAVITVTVTLCLGCAKLPSKGTVKAKIFFAGLRPAPRWGLLAPRPPGYERPLATTPQKAELPLSADPGSKRVRSKKSAI